MARGLPSVGGEYEAVPAASIAGLLLVVVPELLLLRLRLLLLVEACCPRAATHAGIGLWPLDDGDSGVAAPGDCGLLAGAGFREAKASIIEAVTPVGVGPVKMGAPADAAAASADADVRRLVRGVTGANVSVTGAEGASVWRAGCAVAVSSAMAAFGVDMVATSRVAAVWESSSGDPEPPVLFDGPGKLLAPLVGSAGAAAEDKSLAYLTPFAARFCEWSLEGVIGTGAGSSVW